MHTVLLLAIEGNKAKTLWDPTVIGLLVFVSAVGLFCGSVYLLLGTNLGARLGFLVAAGCLTGFMVLLSLVWLTTATPLSSPKGRIPQWKVREVVSIPSESKIGAVRDSFNWPKTVSDEDLLNLRPAIDAALVKAQPAVNEHAPEQPFAQFTTATDFLAGTGNALVAKETGGGTKMLVLHRARYAVVQICPAAKPPANGTTAPQPEPECDPLLPTKTVVLEQDLGSLRQPPLLYFLGSLVLFLLSLRGLHWYELDQRARAAATAASAPSPS